MQNFTQDDYQPNPATLLFVKQFARMYSLQKTADAKTSAWCLN